MIRRPVHPSAGRGGALSCGRFLPLAGAALAGAALGARDAPDTWEQADYLEDRRRRALDVLTRAQEGRMQSGRMSKEEAARIVNERPPAKAGQFTAHTPWEECCDGRWCAYAVSVYDSMYVDQPHADLYRRDLYDPEDEGWREIHAGWSSWSSFMPDPYEMGGHDQLDLAVDRGDLSEEERGRLNDDAEAREEFLDDWRERFEPSAADIADAEAGIAEEWLSDAYDLDPACV